MRGPCPTKTTTTTTPAPYAPEKTFLAGVIDALGYKNAVGCFSNAGTVTKDIQEVVALYRKGGYWNKAKAMAKLAEAMKTIISILESCTAATTDIENYNKLVKDLKDPRYYTTQNALTLALNAAEDRVQLEAVFTDIENGKDYDAGNTLMKTILDVMMNPGIPPSNGTESFQIASGFTRGFVDDIDLKCFQDAKVEVPSLIGGVMACFTGVGTIPGLELVFHGLEGLVPFLKDCYFERKEIKNLLAEFSDFRNPGDLAKKFAHNIAANGIDITLELTQAGLAIKGKEYDRFGLEVGKILSKIVVSQTSVVV